MRSGKVQSGGYDFDALTVDPLIFVPAGKAVKFSPGSLTRPRKLRKTSAGHKPSSVSKRNR